MVNGLGGQLKIKYSHVQDIRGNKTGGNKMTLTPKEMLQIKREYAKWKSGTNPHYPSEQEWFAQAGAQVERNKRTGITPNLSSPDEERI